MRCTWQWAKKQWYPCARASPCSTARQAKEGCRRQSETRANEGSRGRGQHWDDGRSNVLCWNCWLLFSYEFAIFWSGSGFYSVKFPGSGKADEFVSCSHLSMRSSVRDQPIVVFAHELTSDLRNVWCFVMPVVLMLYHCTQKLLRNMAVCVPAMI